MTREQAINLYMAIQDYRAGEMGEKLYPYAMLRLKLKEVTSEYYKVREEITTQTKDKDKAKWKNNFQVNIGKWLDETAFEPDKIFTMREALAYCQHNDVQGSIQDEIIKLLTIQEDA